MTRAVVVTGAAGGIGRSICMRFRRDGFRVIGIDLLPCDDVADMWLKVDLGDLKLLRSEVAELSHHNRFAAIVHNAAMQPISAAGDTPYDVFATALRVNVLAADSLVHAARDNLAEEKGAVVVVSSVHAMATTAGINAYATSKAALEGWVRSAAMDLAPDIRVNAVRPGAVDTAKLQEGFNRWDPSLAGERRAQLISRTPLKRIGLPDEVAAAVGFLAGPDSSFVTGSTLVVDGGASCRLGTE